MVKEAVKMMRSSLPSTLDITTDINPDSGLVLADPIHIHQIVINLCTNAAQAIGSRQGKVEIALYRTTLNKEQVALEKDAVAGPYIVLSVKDNGMGMDENTLSQIFDPYFTTKEYGKGTGLGLAVTRGSVKECNGFIQVESSPEIGTHFQIFLPALAATVTGEEIVAEAPPSGGSERILVVDDEPAITDISNSILTSLGYTVTTANSSLEALERFRQNPTGFDLVLTDLTMPGLTGIELAEIMLRENTEIPIILCSGFSESISREEVLGMGIRKFIAKPLDRRTLAKVVRTVLDD